MDMISAATGQCSASSALYNAMLSGNHSVFNDAVESRSIAPEAATIYIGRVVLATVAGGGGYSFNFRKNGVSQFTAAIGGAASYVDVNQYFTVVAGDELDVVVTPVSSPTYASNCCWSIKIAGATGNWWDGGGIGLFADSSTYCPLVGHNYTTASDTNRAYVPIAGTISGFNVKINVAPGAGKNRTFELYKNGGATGYKVVISDSATSGSVGGTLAVSAGDYLSIRDTLSSGTVAQKSSYSLIFVTTPERIVWLNDVYDTGGGTQTAWNGRGISAIEAPIFAAFTVASIYCYSHSAPATTITCTLYKNGGATGLSFTYVTPATNGSDNSPEVSFVQNDQFRFVTSGPAGAYYKTALVSGGLTQVYNKTLPQTWAFTQLLNPQGFLTRTPVTGTTDLVTGGGRQTVIALSGRLWHAFRDGATLKVMYSDDKGVSWTVTDIGVTFTVSGIALCLDASDRPIVVVSRISNYDFYFYQWDGSAWQFRKRIAIDTDDTASFQLLLSGSTYYLLYGILDAGTNDRRIRMRTSTDLLTWATATTVHNGDGSGTGPHKNRRVAACVDSNGYLHAVYSIRDHGYHKLYYGRYSGAWSTELLLHTGGSGNNLADYQSGLSIAVDAAGNAHIAACIKDATYTSRVKVHYYKVAVSTVLLNEDVHASVDADQGFPSISVNGVNPVICWASAGLGLDAVCARRDGAGTWSRQTLGVGSNVQTICGPTWGSAYRYTRGVAGTLHGSETWFTSTDALAGTGAQLTSTWAFAGILSTQKRLLASTWAFASALIGVRSLTLRSTWAFSQRLNTERPATMANAWAFDHYLGGAVNSQVIYQRWHFAPTLTGVKTPAKTITQTWAFSQNLTRTISARMGNAWTFEGTLSTVTYRRKALAQTWRFASTLGLQFTLRKAVGNTWAFISSLLGMKGDEGCQPTFTPDRPLPASEDDVKIVYLIGPLPSPTLAVQLKRPEYGNARRQALQVGVNRTRAGGLRLHARTPTYEPQSVSFQDLSYLKLEQVRNFLRACKGKSIYYIDEKNRKWVGAITSSDVDLVEEARDRGGVFQFEFEGKLV